MRPVHLAVGAIFAVIFLVFAFSTYYTVGQGERAVVTHYGAVVGVDGPGLHFKMPFVTGVDNVSIAQQKDSFDKAGDKDYRMEAYTQDQQPVTVAVSILYHVSDVTALFVNYGSIDGLEQKLINPKAYEQVKNVFGRYTSISAIQDRAKLNAEVFEAITRSVKGGPLVIDSVQVQDVEFSNSYETSVENRMKSIVAQEQAQAEKQKRIIDADAAAYEVKAEADAQAHATEVKGDAEAHAIKARGDALRDNPGLPALVTAEKWNGQLPATMPPNGTVPFLHLTPGGN